MLGVICLCICTLNAVILYGQRHNISLGYPDFKIYYSEALLYRTHPGAAMYDYALQAREQNRLFPAISTPGRALPYNHPPYELLLFLPLSYLSFEVAFYSWMGLTFLLTVTAGILLARSLQNLTDYWRPFAVALILASYPYLVLLLQGQTRVLRSPSSSEHGSAYAVSQTQPAGSTSGLGSSSSRYSFRLQCCSRFGGRRY